MIGLLSTFTGHMKDRYKMNLTPVKFNSYSDMIKALKNGDIDTAFPIYGSYWQLDSRIKTN